MSSISVYAADPCEAISILSGEGNSVNDVEELNQSTGGTLLEVYKCGSASNTVWFGPIFVPATGIVSLTTCGSTYDTQLSVYTSSDGTCNGVASGVEIGCNDDDFMSNSACGGSLQSSVELTGLTPGEPLWVAVDGFAGDGGTLILNLDQDTRLSTEAAFGEANQESDVPTLSEWALILLALLLVNWGAVRLSVPVLASNQSHFSKISTKRFLPFNETLFNKALIVTGVLGLMGFVLCFYFYHTLFLPDLFGFAVCGPLFAYLIHLIYWLEKEA